ncbi:MAG: hypothetical protein OXG58_11375 [Gemmatimonadetes bacterium]|nr:hypothetical protein [Gemmatimonadota bacterium]MCY3942980.1 hypothetical protein [Gemmatimonadota bacterium]
MPRSLDKESRIPVGTQFSPNLISLSSFVAAAVEHSGDREALLEAVWRPEVRIRRPRKEPTKRLRSLPLESAVQYGLLAEETYEARLWPTNWPRWGHPSCLTASPATSCWSAVD